MRPEEFFEFLAMGGILGGAREQDQEAGNGGKLAVDCGSFSG